MEELRKVMNIKDRKEEIKMINNEWSERESVKLSNVIMEQMMNRGLTLEVLEKATENVKSVFYTDAIVKKG